MLCTIQLHFVHFVYLQIVDLMLTDFETNIYNNISH